MAIAINNNLYPKFVLNEAGAYTTDTMHRVFIKEGVNKKAFVASHYNSLSFAFAEILRRRHPRRQYAHTFTPPPSQGYGFDDAVSIGEWQPVDTLTPEQQERAASLIAEASRFFTLRQGDILLLEPHGEPFPVHIGDRIEMPPYLAFNIK